MEGCTCILLMPSLPVLQELVKFCILPVTVADLAEEERKHQRTAVAA